MKASQSQPILASNGQTEAQPAAAFPWSFAEYGSPRGTYYVRDANDKTIAQSLKCGEANARLIAAAPDLLEALKRSAEGWANAVDLKIILPQHVPAATILRDECHAAIAKATDQ